MARPPRIPGSMPPRSPRSAPIKPQLPELKQRRVGEILDASIKIWGANIKKLALVTGILVFPFQMLGSLALTLLKPTIYDEIQRVQDLTGKGQKAKLSITPRMTMGVLIDVGLSTFGSVLVIAAISVFMWELYASPKPHITSDSDSKELLRQVLRRIPVLFATHLLVIVISGLALLAVAVPLGVAGELLGVLGIATLSGIFGAAVTWFVFVVLHCAWPSIMLEKTSPIATLRRSVRLSKKRRRMIVGAAIVLTLLTAIPAQIVTEIIRSILTSLGGNNTGFAFVWFGLAKTAATALSAPISAIAAVLVFWNLRLHKGESIDLQPVLPVAPVTGETPLPLS